MRLHGWRKTYYALAAGGAVGLLTGSMEFVAVIALLFGILGLIDDVQQLHEKDRLVAPLPWPILFLPPIGSALSWQERPVMYIVFWALEVLTLSFLVVGSLLLLLR